MTRGSGQPAMRDVERIVIASVAMTARALAEVAPDLTFIQWRVLVMADEPGGVAIGSLATALGAKLAAMSRLVGRLRERGLVETARSEADRRVVLVRPTAAGSDLRRRVVERRRGEIAAALHEADLAPTAADVVERIASVLEHVA